LMVSFLQRHHEIFNDEGKTAGILTGLADQDRAAGQVIESAGKLQVSAARGVLVLRAGIQKVAADSLTYVDGETAIPATDAAGRQRQCLLSAAFQAPRDLWSLPVDKAQASKVKLTQAAQPIQVEVGKARGVAAGVQVIDSFLESLAGRAP